MIKTLRRPSTVLSATIVASLLAALSPIKVSAEHDHGMCPDYPQYSDVLQNGMEQLEHGGSARRSDIYFDDPGSSSRTPGATPELIPPMWKEMAKWQYTNHEAPNLQQTIDSALAAEGNGDVFYARRWWMGIADELKKKTEHARYKFQYSCALSRLGDISLISNGSDATVLSDEEFDRDNDSMSVKTSAGMRRYLKDAADRLSTTEISKTLTELRIPPLASNLRSRFSKALDKLERTSADKSMLNKNALDAIRQAKNNYAEAVQVGRLLPAESRGLYFAADLVKLASVAEFLGEKSYASEQMQEAVMLFSETRDNDAWINANRYEVSSLPAEFITKKLIVFQKNKSLGVETQLQRYFPGRWVPTAMKCYANLGDRDSVLRLYQTFGSVTLSNTLDTSQVLERLKVANSLAQVGEPQEAMTYCQEWRKTLPEDPIGRAFVEVAIAEFMMKRGEPVVALTNYKTAIEVLWKIVTQSEYVANAQLNTSVRIASGLSKLSTPEAVALRKSAASLKQKARDRIMQLECLALAKQLAETGRKLERRGNYAAASEMFEAACDIKLKNLGASDIETATQQIDAGRTLSLTGKPKEAARQLASATKALRSMPDRDKDLYRNALENYADALSKSDQTNEAEKIYDELRRIP